MLMFRRSLLALAFSFALTHAFAADSTPTTPITAIYKRASVLEPGGRNSAGGNFVGAKDKERRHHFTARTAKLWRDAEKLTPKGDQGPIGFDPVTNSQDPLVQAFDVAIEKQDATRATVVVRISDKPGPITRPAPREIIRYDMVRERGRWLIDDIRGTIDTEWSLRKMLSDYRG